MEAPAGLGKHIRQPCRGTLKLIDIFCEESQNERPTDGSADDLITAVGSGRTISLAVDNRGRNRVYPLLYIYTA